MREGRVTAIVPVRAGSQRVKHKSIRNFCDTSLLEHKLKQLLRIEQINSIILTTDSPEAKDIGNRYGVRVIDRTGYYASSECNNSDFFRYIAEQTTEEDKYLIYTPVTSPFVTKDTICTVIRKFMGSEGHDSVVPVEVLRHHMWMNGRPLNYDLKNAPNTQDLPHIYALNYACSIISREDQIRLASLCGETPLFHEMGQMEAVDIDTMYDFELAQTLYKSKQAEDPA